MTVYNFLTVAAKSHSAIVGGGKTDDISVDLNSGCIYSGSKMIVVEGEIAAPQIELTNGEKYDLNALIEFEGNAYDEIERLYAQYKKSVPNRHVKLNKGYFKALSSDALSMKELTENVSRSQARLELEGFILLASAIGRIPWTNPEHFFWQSQVDPDCIIYREWILKKNERK